MNFEGTVGMDAIEIRGARENNLKNISLSIPKNKLVVVTGPSGSGKSTLAMDTLQRECQRQFMESMGMLTDSINKPKVESIAGLSPAISVGQHVTNRNPRSTVGTVTDIYTYLRLIYAKAGERPCPACGATILPAIETGSFAGIGEEEERTAHGEFDVCPVCARELPKLTMAHFSFNKPEGACEECGGMGTVASLDTELAFKPELGFRQGGVSFLFGGAVTDYFVAILSAGAKHYGFAFDPDLPLRDYPEIASDFLYYGAESERFARHVPGIKPPKSVSSGKFEGLVTGLWRRYREKGGDSGEAALFRQRTCPACGGARMKQQIVAVKVGGVSIAEVNRWQLEAVGEWVERIVRELSEASRGLLEPVFHDLPQRIRRVLDVGLGYLSLDRQSVTLSGGEAQRLRLASLLGSGLTGVLYVLDEPTAGLHPRDTEGLIAVMKRLRDLGNTVLVIEHDTEVMRAADHVIDMGPGAGSFGGEVVGEGGLETLMASERSVTGAYLRELRLGSPERKRRPGNGKRLTIRDAVARNLQGITVSFPLGCMVAVTGVSGSGKSTLVFELLSPEGREGGSGSGGCAGIDGLEHAENWITVDQSPLGRMSRSNVATYSDVYTSLRNLFAGLPQAKKNNLTSKHFSFNTAGGRCESCQGLGVISIHMHFMAEIEVRCPVCHGRRFREEVLAVTYEGRSISELLDMTIQESLPILNGADKMSDMIRLLCDVGLGYLKWGQSVTTLSGGEGQRLRLAKELARRTKKHTVYLLDEPTTGLHPADVKRLLVLLNRLVDAGNTVIAVEHNIDLVREADWVVDIGPDGGLAGGMLVAAGTPEQVARTPESHTGRFLREALAVPPR